MKQLITKDDSLDIVELVNLRGQESVLQEILPSPPLGEQQSYHSTPWGIVNASLAILDTVTHGRAGVLQRLTTFVLFGGIAAVVNLGVFYVVFYHIPLPVTTAVHNVIASVLAAEISIMANFIPNDHFTFRYLPGRSRSWTARCARFHVTSVGGSMLTFLIEFGFSSIGHIPAIIAQAAALILVLFYNFSFHHIFTYRHVKV
ncbi:MAG: hypothetical protein NVS4B12_13730 [Ktedonobacteraceae bacterium]